MKNLFLILIAVFGFSSAGFAQGETKGTIEQIEDLGVGEIMIGTAAGPNTKAKLNGTLVPIESGDFNGQTVQQALESINQAAGSLQTLTAGANPGEVSISGANSVTIDVNDADNFPDNWNNLPGKPAGFDDGVDDVDDADNFPDTWANLPGKPAGFDDGVDDVDDADSDPDNEKQTVTRTGNDLVLSLGGGTQPVLDIYEYRVVNVTTAGATVALGVTPDLTYRPEVRRNGVWQDVNLTGSDVTISGSNITANHRNWKSGDKIQLRYVPQ